VFLRVCNQSFSWKRTWKFTEMSYFTDLRQIRGAKKKHSETVLKTRLKIHLFFGFRKITCGLFAKGIFSVFGRFIEEIHWEDSQEPDVLIKIWKQIWNQRTKIFSIDKNLFIICWVVLARWPSNFSIRHYRVCCLLKSFVCN
jgi:hypothetical protein